MTPDILGPCTIYLGDNQNLPPITADALISDPPYGSKTDTDYTRFSGGLSPSRNHHKQQQHARSGTPFDPLQYINDKAGTTWEGIHGDNVPFDPRPWLQYKKVCLWGYQYFAHRVPLGSTLVWIKKGDNALGKFLSDAELAWVKGGHGVYCFRHIWNGFQRDSERGRTLHPTQKPVALFDWVLTRLKVQPGQTVFDPYMGSGPLALACIKRGVKYVGCEIHPDYYATARERIAKALLG